MDFHKFYYGFIAGVRVINVYVPIYSKKIVDELTEKIFAWDIILALVGLKLLQGLYFFFWKIKKRLLQIFFFQGGGAMGGNGLLNMTRSFLWIKVSQYTKREIQIGLFKHLHGLSLRWHLSRFVIIALFMCISLYIYVFYSFMCMYFYVKLDQINL